MSFEDKFKRQITDFKSLGTYTYKYDEAGNLVFDSSSIDFSHVYLALPLQCIEYDSGKILNFYDPTFTEFVPSVNDISLDEKLEDVQVELENVTAQK